jgi:hypothetical protein
MDFRLGMREAVKELPQKAKQTFHELLYMRGIGMAMFFDVTSLLTVAAVCVYNVLRIGKVMREHKSKTMMDEVAKMFINMALCAVITIAALVKLFKAI